MKRYTQRNRMAPRLRRAIKQAEAAWARLTTEQPYKRDKEDNEIIHGQRNRIHQSTSSIDVSNTERND